MSGYEIINAEEIGLKAMQLPLVNHRQEIERLLSTLSEDDLSEVLSFLQYLRFKQNQATTGSYQVVDKFEGIWADYALSEEDIIAARQEMWGNFGRERA